MKLNERCVDSHKWIKSLRLEYWRVNQIRSLHVGEVFWIAYFDGPGVVPEVPGHCEIYIERVQGGYEFGAVWTINLTPKKHHAHILTFGDFKLLKGNIVEFATETDVEGEKLFRKVARYANFIYRKSDLFGIAIKPPYRYHPLWRGEIIFNNGMNKRGVQGPMPQGLGAIANTAKAIGISDYITNP